MVSRRGWLAGVALLPTGHLASCLSTTNPLSASEDWDGTTPGEIESHCDQVGEVVWCGQAEPIEVTEPFDDHEHHHLNENGTVEMQLTIGNDPKFETLAFDEWGDFAARYLAGGPPAIDHVRAALDNENGLRSGIGGSHHPEGLGTPFLAVYTGEELDNPVGVDEVRAVAPMYADTTVSISGRDYRQAVPVFVRTYDQLAQPA